MQASRLDPAPSRHLRPANACVCPLFPYQNMCCAHMIQTTCAVPADPGTPYC